LRGERAAAQLRVILEMDPENADARQLLENAEVAGNRRITPQPMRVK
jgi:hypothetical protein